MIRHEEHILPYERIYKYQDDRGYIIWRYGTGGTVELLHLEAAIHRLGYGRSLVEHMLSELSTEDITTVYGFTRERLIQAQVFYLGVGFKLIKLPNHYSDGGAVMFHRPYLELSRFLSSKPRPIRN